MRTTSETHNRLARRAEQLRATCHAIWFPLVVLLTAIPVVPVLAGELLPPPYFIPRSEAVVIGVAYEEGRVKRMVSAGLQIAPDATGQIIMYTAEESYGLPAYSSSWMGVDLVGFDAPGGSKARWMLTGLYSPPSVTEALAKYFGYPTREGTTRVERNGHRVIAVGTMGGREIIRAELVLKPEACQRGSGMIHEVTRKDATGPLQLIKIPYVADWCAAESAKVDITASANDPFGQLNPVKVLWGGYFHGGFGWSEPAGAR